MESIMTMKGYRVGGRRRPERGKGKRGTQKNVSLISAERRRPRSAL
jgi:hypothetical protein